MSPEQSDHPDAPAEPANHPAPKRRLDLKKWISDHKVWTGLIAAAIILIPAGVWAYLHYHHKPKSEPSAQSAEPAPVLQPATVPDPLTGLEVTPQVAAQPVFGVVIENSPEARPQSALSSAGVVYEALAEGGITRFLAVFQDQQPASIGPVRSLRPYFIDWIQEYNNAPIAHAGGSAQALGEVGPLGVKSMNGLIYSANFQRVSDRFAPHNLYTSTSSLLSLMQRLGYTTAPSFTSWAYKADAAEATPSHPSITITYSYPLFTAKYSFDANCDCYARALAGAAHIDRNTNQQIKVKNVVAITVQTSYDASGHALMTTVGSGKAVIFRDGGAVVGTWKKDARTSRIKFLDATGAEIQLDRGNTWISVVPQTGSVIY
ncbi:MAG TPA: DUF3048 domain-containing protein [Candidatus Saccharimonadales bacterium]|nr:DUF3048 domain-containing protein [Candidatus Saccharimonadales bacterium]